MTGASRKNKIASILFVLGFILTVVAISISFSYNTAAAAVTTTQAVRVLVGGGSLTNPLFGYTPENVEIKVGQTVLWYAQPSGPVEPHTQ